MLDNGDQFHNQQLNRSMKSRHLLMLSLGELSEQGYF